ncbi:hypothetical protein [Burkholderia pseudomallei]|uniref:hypothetical protein n=1 Tax=Burkholderia pseudomallei TaxID=28450 RepID=UPI0012FD7FB9|nr:hypothetical protein [Burkholderia pseudomallei]
MGIQPLDSPALSRTRQTSGNTCESRCRPEDDIPVSRFISRMPGDIDIGASGIPYPASGLWHPVSGIRRRYIGHRARMAFSTTFVGKLVDILSIRRPTR